VVKMTSNCIIQKLKVKSELYNQENL